MPQTKEIYLLDSTEIKSRKKIIFTKFATETDNFNVIQN